MCQELKLFFLAMLIDLHPVQWLLDSDSSWPGFSGEHHSGFLVQLMDYKLHDRMCCIFLDYVLGVKRLQGLILRWP